MIDLRKSILATIIYYDIFNFPLTFAEVYKYLINPKRFSNRRNVVNEIRAGDLIDNLDSMARAGLIGCKNGFYFMPGKDDLYEERIEKDKLANRKWKKFLKIAKYLQLAPYLRAIFVSGSLAANNPESKSDFDVLVVIKTRRLYTGRFFLWLISSLLRARRGRFDLVAPDKICFNHYLTDNDLEFLHRSLYVAQSLVNMKPVFAPVRILDSFITSNKWVYSYCYNFKCTDIYRGIKSNKIMSALAGIGEAILDTTIGDFIEKMLRTIQQRRIKNNPATYESGGRVIFTDKELEFHPRSFEKTVTARYNIALKNAGIFSPEEKDSGLMS